MGYILFVALAAESVLRKRYRPMKSWVRRATDELRNPQEERQKSLVVYSCRVELLKASLRKQFLQLCPDDESHAFVRSCVTTRQVPATFAAVALSCFCVALSDANALLNTGEMYLLSTAQAQLILSYKSQLTKSTHKCKLLDIGAGDGSVTSRLVPLFDEVTVTEVSKFKVKRLRKQGYKCIATDMAAPHTIGDNNFDVVSCLNVVDRCSKPLSLLKQIKTILEPQTGVLLLSVVLPFEPFVECGKFQEEPDELIELCCGKSWEEQVTAFIDQVITPAGYVVSCLSRLPYYSRGDIQTPYYVLDAAVFLLEPTERRIFQSTGHTISKIYIGLDRDCEEESVSDAVVFEPSFSLSPKQAECT